MTLLDAQKALFRFRVVKFLLGLFFLSRGLLRLPFAPYLGITDLCWVYRVSGIGILQRAAYRRITGYVFDPRQGHGRLMRAFLESSVARRAANRIVQREAPYDSMFRDIMVLKAPANGEKGVIVLEYTVRFDLFVALFDYERIIKDYYIVLEPCWAGYCDPSILMFIGTQTDIIVQAPETRDFEFLEQLNCNLKPIVLGSSDWIDSDLFSAPPPGSPRPYDLVMVANWAKHKNHRKLFAALERVRHRPISLLLIGIDWGGRTGDDIRREFGEFELSHVTLEMKTSIPAREVARHLGESKVFLLLSEKEGSNRAIVEALFADTPVIFYEHFVGGAKGKVTPATGLLSSFEDLGAAIDRALDMREQFTPRAWAMANTGSANARAKLDAMLAGLAASRKEPWTTGIVEKVNNPNSNNKHANDLPADAQAAAATRRYLRDEWRSRV